MPHETRPLTHDDVPDLSRFLVEGFHAPEGAEFAAADVLRWKYFDPIGDEAGRGLTRSFLTRETEGGRVVGHVGICPTRLRGVGVPAGGISAMHGIDWLASGGGSGVGARLLYRSHRDYQAGYLIVASDAARVVTARAGYEPVASVPVYQNVLRPGYRLRLPGLGLGARAIRAAKDAALKVARPARPPRGAGRGLTLSPVSEFGEGVRAAVAFQETRAILTARLPGLLNHLLRYPRRGISGWSLDTPEGAVGFAILGVIPRAGSIREGRVIEFLLDRDDPDLRHAAAFALTAELKRQGADVALAFGSTGATARALEASGYAPAYSLELTLRDRDRLVPRDVPFHVTPFDSDYAYS